MSERIPGENRDFRDDMDDMGDDEQAEEIALTERYIEDPPEDLVIEEPENAPVGITEYERQTARRGEDTRPGPDTPAEEDAIHETPRP